MNIQEDYVSFETAKLLKEKGFEGCSILTIYDENAASAYIKELQEKHLPYSSDDPKLKEFYYPQPTLQMAMKWLRKVHDIDISIIPLRSHKEYLPRIESDTISHDAIPCKKHEEACEAAIKYCLENLI